MAKFFGKILSNTVGYIDSAQCPLDPTALGSKGHRIVIKLTIFPHITGLPLPNWGTVKDFCYIFDRN